MLSILFVLSLLWTLAFQNSTEAQQLEKISDPKIYFVNVGQGDFTILALRDSCWIFDPGGESSQVSKNLLGLLSKQCALKSINVVLSHFDRDHYSKLKGLTRIGHFENFYYSNPNPHSTYGKKLLFELRNIFRNPVQIVIPKKMVIEGVEINLTPPLGSQKKKIENDWSLVTKIVYGKKNILITGDAPPGTQNLATTKPIDILRVSHHGSQHNTSNSLLEKLKPKTCVVSVGDQNSYGHPHPKLLHDLVKHRCAILRTDRLGTIEVSL